MHLTLDRHALKWGSDLSGGSGNGGGNSGVVVFVLLCWSHPQSLNLTGRGAYKYTRTGLIIGSKLVLVVNYTSS